MKQLGVDISEHNGSVDFSILQNAGVQFVILRCGFGSDYTNQDDARFKENVQKAEAAGMPWGAYLYSYAVNSSMAKSEAQHALRLLQEKKPLYGVWYDMEDNSTLGGDLLGAAQGFCDTMEAAGLYAGVYASLNWWNNYLTASGFDQYDRWVAQYYSECQCKKPYGIWQYTSTWSIGGKNFDGNWAYKDYPTLVRAMNGEKEEPELTEAEVKKLARQEIEAYFNELAKKPVSNWAKEAVEFVQAEGLMNGDADGNFRPQSPITRQEVAAVLMNEREK